MRGTKNLQTALCFIMSLLITLCFMSLGPDPRKSSGPPPLLELKRSPRHRPTPLCLSWNRSLDTHCSLLCYVFTATILKLCTDAALCAKLQSEICPPRVCSLVMTPTILCRSDDSSSFLEVERWLTVYCRIYTLQLYKETTHHDQNLSIGNWLLVCPAPAWGEEAGLVTV